MTAFIRQLGDSVCDSVSSQNACDSEMAYCGPTFGLRHNFKYPVFLRTPPMQQRAAATTQIAKKQGKHQPELDTMPNTPWHTRMHTAPPVPCCASGLVSQLMHGYAVHPHAVQARIRCVAIVGEHFDA